MPTKPEDPQAEDRAYWTNAVFTLIGHAAALQGDGARDMPAWLYELAERIAREHIDEAHAKRVRDVAVLESGKSKEPQP